MPDMCPSWGSHRRKVVSVEFTPLSTLVPAWTGSYVPKAYAAVKEGLRQQRIRFRDFRYLVLSIVSHTVYKDFSFRLYFEVGSNDPENAANLCKQVLQYRMLQEMIRSAPAMEEMQEGVGRAPEVEQWKACDGTEVTRMFHSPRVDLLAWQRCVDIYIFHHIEVQVGVLELTPGYGLSDEDLEALSEDHHLVADYLRDEGSRW